MLKDRQQRGVDEFTKFSDERYRAKNNEANFRNPRRNGLRGRRYRLLIFAITRDFKTVFLSPTNVLKAICVSQAYFYAQGE